MDGEMQFETSTSQTYKGERGDRGNVTRHQDNLRLEGNIKELFCFVSVYLSVRTSAFTAEGKCEFNGLYMWYKDAILAKVLWAIRLRTQPIHCVFFFGLLVCIFYYLMLLIEHSNSV